MFGGPAAVVVAIVAAAVVAVAVLVGMVVGGQDAQKGMGRQKQARWSYRISCCGF